MLIRSVTYGLDEIVEGNDVVLIDASFEFNDKICAKIYNQNESLSLTEIDIQRLIEDASEWVRIVSENDHVHTIRESLAEIEEYLKILNQQREYHSKNVETRRFNQGKVIRSKHGKGKKDRRKDGRKRKTRSYEYIGDEEVSDLDNLRIYTNNVFDLVNLLKKGVIEINDTNLLEQVKKRIKEKGLKKVNKKKQYDLDNFRSRKPLGYDSDERIVVDAYELAEQDKGVAIISNKNLSAILNLCFDNRLFDSLSRGYIQLFTGPQEGYQVTYDSRLLLCHETEFGLNNIKTL